MRNNNRVHRLDVIELPVAYDSPSKNDWILQTNDPLLSLIDRKRLVSFANHYILYLLFLSFAAYEYHTFSDAFTNDRCSMYRGQPRIFQRPYRWR